MITVRVLLFGHYKTVFPPQGETTVTLEEGATAADAAQALAARDPRLEDLLARTRVAVQAEFAEAETVLQNGDEVAFLPPMSGG